MPLNPEIKRLRKLSPAALADESGAAKATTEAIKDEMIRRDLRRADGAFWKIALSPPSVSNRTDRARLLEALDITDEEFVVRFTSPTETDWRLTCTPRKIRRPKWCPSGRGKQPDRSYHRRR
jgi:hypothetical protein